MANRRLRLLIIDAHPRMFADPQDDSIFHPRTWHRAAGCARTLGRLSNHPTRPRRASRGNGAAAANQPRRVMKTIAFVSWQIVDDDDLRAKRPQDQRELSGMGCEKFVSAHIRLCGSVGHIDLAASRCTLLKHHRYL